MRAIVAPAGIRLSLQVLGAVAGIAIDLAAQMQAHLIVTARQPTGSPNARTAARLHRLNTYRHRNASITNPNAGETCRRPA